jgi:lipoate-protein ligase A
MNPENGQKFLFFSNSCDPYDNLVLEELLWENYSAQHQVYLVYVNKPCVVIGRHQNPWQETRPSALRGAGIPLLRRISGGGTVWHDEGNINFSWMGPRALYHRQIVDYWIQKALAPFDFSFDISAKGDYLYKGAKFSGNAFAFRSDRVLHHGTLLVQSDLVRLKSYMGGIRFAQSVGVPSRPAVVMNLQEANCEIRIDALLKTLEEATGLTYRVPPKFLEEKTLRQLRQSEAWILGETPRFVVHEAGGHIVEVVNGKIDDHYFDEELVG